MEVEKIGVNENRNWVLWTQQLQKLITSRQMRIFMWGFQLLIADEMRFFLIPSLWVYAKWGILYNFMNFWSLLVIFLNSLTILVTRPSRKWIELGNKLWWHNMLVLWGQINCRLNFENRSINKKKFRFLCTLQKV